MQVRVVEASPHRVVLEAPLKPNRNHHGTVFGGSVSTVATLAGWALVHLRLRAEGLDGHTVIQRGSVDYEVPIASAFQAVCDGVDEATWTRFRRTTERRGKGRISVDVAVEADGVLAARFRGKYVTLAADVEARTESLPLPDDE